MRADESAIDEILMSSPRRRRRSAIF
jgi:hypothetical protein